MLLAIWYSTVWNRSHGLDLTRDFSSFDNQLTRRSISSIVTGHDPEFQFSDPVTSIIDRYGVMCDLSYKIVKGLVHLNNQYISGIVHLTLRLIKHFVPNDTTSDNTVFCMHPPCCRFMYIFCFHLLPSSSPYLINQPSI
jgi:hypothetical protein